MTRQARERIRSGELRGADLLAWIREHPSDSRDRALEELLGIARPVDQLGGAPGADRMPYMPSAIAPVVRAVLDVPITRDDVFVDLGAGLGKAAMAVHLLTGARARGVELQPALVTAAQARARELALDGVEFVRADALEADLDDATVVFLYLPFTGDVLAGVLRRLEAIARRRQLVICTLGLDLRGADWIAERPTEEFWLSIYESRIPGAVPRPPGSPSPLAALGEAIARER
ncbi:MAG TPA: methyltransferase domain-containing protein [Polyangiaceae bacterium]|nr:methyltransferase domain-containing protein [Polyangiaceae bacterium]